MALKNRMLFKLVEVYNENFQEDICFNSHVKG